MKIGEIWGVANLNVGPNKWTKNILGWLMSYAPAHLSFFHNSAHCIWYILMAMHLIWVKFDNSNNITIKTLRVTFELEMLDEWSEWL